MKITDEAMEAFTQYRRSQVAEMRPWQPGDDVSGVSVSAEDAKEGSPKSGDMIARNPKNHADQWLVAAAYFADNFEPLAALPHLSQGAVRVSAPLHDALQRWRDEDHEETIALSREQVIEVCEEFRALSPAPVGVTDKMVEIVAKKVADFLGYAWEGLNSHSVVEQGCRMFTHGQFGWSFHGGQPDLRNVARDLLEAALASHEPAPTDTQEGLSEAGEVVWHRYCWTDNPDVWLGSKDDPRILLGHSNFVVEPLVRQSALTACQQELERLRVQKDEWKERAATVKRKLSAEYERAEAAEARIAELVKELEKIKAEATIANDVIRLNRDNGGQGRVKVATAMHRIAAVARAALGGQSNE